MKEFLTKLNNNYKIIIIFLLSIVVLYIMLEIIDEVFDWIF